MSPITLRHFNVRELGWVLDPFQIDRNQRSSDRSRFKNGFSRWGGRHLDSPHRQVRNLATALFEHNERLAQTACPEWLEAASSREIIRSSASTAWRPPATSSSWWPARARWRVKCRSWRLQAHLALRSR